jgi:ferredoxin
MKRSIIRIDEEKCNGCGECIPNCPEGAIQLIDGKARLVSDLFCDGLGACLGHCPLGAITVEQREAAPYDERLVMQNIIQAGPNTIHAHLSHLKEHGEEAFLKTTLDVLREKGIAVPAGRATAGPAGHP